MSYQQCQCKNNAEKNPARNVKRQDHTSVECINHRFDRLERQNSELRRDMKKVLENTEILKDKADAVLRQTFQLAEFTVPRLFIVLPEYSPRYNPAHWLHLNYRLYFLCECENDIERHFAFHEGYEIKQPREFFRIYGPHLRKMLTVMKYAIPACSLVVPELSNIVDGIPDSVIVDKSLLDHLSIQVDQLGEILTIVEQSENISTERYVQYMEGVELRKIQSFLKKVDVHHKFGNLYRSVTSDGHVRWVCIQHYQQCYSGNAIKGLHEEFHNLGGEITRDTALIGEQASNNFSKILSVLCKGLRVCSIILKNLNIKHKDFDELLNFVSQQSAIHSLQLENITVLSHPFNIKKRVIISKLNTTVEANDKLNIQYSFTKPLSEFASETIHAMIEINPRLIFRVRSREETPSLELVGTNKTGFTLSINNSDEKYNISYHTAIKNIFEIIPNINKILLHKGVISESIWTCFYQFLTTSQTLQELTIDCRLTIEQTKKLSLSLSDNRMLKTLHMLNIWEPNDEFDGFEEIFQILQKNAVLVEFILTCHTDLLQLDSVAKCLLQNKSLRILRLPKCEIHQNTDIELCESFLQNTSIHTLSLELISTNCEASLERLARVLDKNQTLETLELKCSDSSAIFYRKNHVSDSEKSLVCSSPAQTSIDPSRKKPKRFLGLFSCLHGEHHHGSDEEIIPPAVVPTLEDNSKHISIEPFYTLCKHAPFYKQMQEIAQSFKLEELQVTIGDYIEMRDIPLCFKWNLTVTELRISRRILTIKDIQTLVEALHNNTKITHLSLNEISISINYFREIFNVLRNDRTLRVLEVSNCISHSDRDLFIEQIKALELNNPSLKVLYENQ